MVAVAAIFLLAALTTQDAVITLLNSPNSCSPRRYAEAKALLEREAAEGKPLQQFVLGVTTKDAKLAKKHLDASRARIVEMAEARNNPLAWYLLSVESNDLRLLRRAVEGNNVQALNAYGTILVQEAMQSKTSVSNGQSSAVSRGYECFRKAAAGGDPNGFVNLGTCYLRGLGCPVDKALAHECFLSAAKAGHPEAMDYVAADYQLGNGVRKNPELSLVWHMKAKSFRGDAAATEWLKTGTRK